MDGTAKGRPGLVVVLRLFGTLDLLAILAVLMPDEWMARGHQWLGLGELPRAPIVGYLARSASALYALHGATILFISTDTVRYARLITFLAVVALIHGAILLGIDLAAGMPAWWTWFEGRPSRSQEPSSWRSSARECDNAHTIFLDGCPRLWIVKRNREVLLS
jgi:hypothetical protein